MNHFAKIIDSQKNFEEKMSNFAVIIEFADSVPW